MTEPAFPREGRILLAVSGGADSMAMLHMAWKAGLDIVCAHFDHQIRGEESRRDRLFVEDWCARRGIETATGRGDVPSYARSRGMGLEEAARELRYAFLRSAALERGCKYIATAHNAGDNAETMLLNLIRGTGARGLRGIAKERGSIIRPMLSLTRREIEDYLQREGVEHVEDSSNASDLYSRNRLRHRVMPVLRELQPRLEEAMGRTARLLEQDEDCLNGLALAFIKEHRRGEGLDAKALLKEHRAIASRAVRLFLGEGLSLEQVEAVLELCSCTELRYLDLPGRRISIQRGILYPQAPEPITFPDRELEPGKSLSIPELGLEIRSRYGTMGRDTAGEVHGLFKTYSLKYENIYAKVRCTQRRPGDAIRPAGRGLSKSLKALFSEAGLSQGQKARTLVIRDDKGPLLVPGLAIDQRCLPREGDRVLILEIEQKDGREV